MLVCVRGLSGERWSAAQLSALSGTQSACVHGAASWGPQGDCVCVQQIENASEVLITPLEKFRKEQIGAAKVGGFGLASLLGLRTSLWLGAELRAAWCCLGPGVPQGRALLAPGVGGRQGRSGLHKVPWCFLVHPQASNAPT